jgi:hypothetical protein
MWPVKRISLLIYIQKKRIRGTLFNLYFATILAIKGTETSVPINYFFFSNERHCSTDIFSVNLLNFVNKERSENSNLVKKNCGGTNAHLLTRRCYNNIFLSDRCTISHSTIIVVFFISVVIELKENLSKISE